MRRKESKVYKSHREVLKASRALGDIARIWHLDTSEALDAHLLTPDGVNLTNHRPAIVQAWANIKALDRGRDGPGEDNPSPNPTAGGNTDATGRPDMTQETTQGDGEQHVQNDARPLQHMLQTAADRARAAIKTMCAEEQRAGAERAAKREQDMLDKKPKQAHRNIFGKGLQDAGPVNAVRDTLTGQVTIDPARVAEIVERDFSAQLKPPGGKKTGRYLPADAPRDYPWERATATDRFKVENDATGRSKRQWMHNSICDKTAFDECFRKMSNGKASGPDGVTNELLKMLPDDIKEILFHMHIFMWATGVTPDAWKVSNTVLLHKKGDVTLLDNKRPVALANAPYKLWTTRLAHCLSEFAEVNRMFGVSQSGFRALRDTSTPLQTLVSVLEDARLSTQNCYLLLIDFTKAFNMTDHDKMLILMYDMGFATDAVDVVKNLYTNARTRFKLAHGYTKEVSVGRGTLQGDALSPFLFLLYIEPLLRWLQVGGRGYQCGCIPDNDVSEKLGGVDNMPPQC